MADYYKTLGVERDATQDQIKKAYRSMSMKHHPDRGGEEAKFKEVSEAYNVLSDPQKKAEYDSLTTRSFHFKEGDNFDDVFGDFFKHARRRKSIVRINLLLDLETLIRGGKKWVTFQDTDGIVRRAQIDVPIGVEENQTIRYPDIFPDKELQITFRIGFDQTWERDGLDLIRNYDINIWDLILGTKIEIETLLKQKVALTVPAGTQPNAMLRVKGKGLPGKGGKVGDVYVILNARVPKNIPEALLDAIKPHRN